MNIQIASKLLWKRKKKTFILIKNFFSIENRITSKPKLKILGNLDKNGKWKKKEQ